MTTENLYSEQVQHHASDSAPAPAPTGATEESENIYLLDLLLVIAERKRVVFGVTAVFALLAILISLLMPQVYTATVVLLPPQQNSSTSSAMTSQLSGLAALAGGSLGIKNPSEMYVSMFKSRTVEEGVARKFNLMQEYHSRYISDAAKSFAASTTVEAGPKDGLIEITVKDRDPRRAAELANGYIDQFRLLSQNLAITEASQRRLFFEQELNKAKNNLANAEEELRKTQQTTGVLEIDSQTRALIGAAAGLRAQIEAKEVQIEGMQTYATGENSQLVLAQQELAGMREQMAKLGGSEDGANAGLIVPKGRVPEAGLEYLRKVRDVKYNETIFEILARQFEMAKLDEAREGALIQVVDSAVPPDKRSSPRRGLIVIVATVFGLIFGVIVAFLQSGYQRLQQYPETAEKILKLRRDLLPRILRENRFRV
jgi:tyrosine-protein kinase Etk/Wzc